MDDERIVAKARDQHGCITARQAKHLGATDQGLRTQVDSGRWSRLRKSVFVVGAAAQTWEQRVMAVCLAAGSDCVASFRSAARLWSLVARSGRIQVTVGGGRRVRLSGVEVRRSELLAVMDCTTVQQIPVTSFARTIVDLSMTQSPKRSAAGSMWAYERDSST